MAAGSAFERLLAALEGNGQSVRHSGQDRATAQCPAHEDRNPSLGLRRIEGLALVHCHAGCETTEVLAALGLTVAQLFDSERGASYRYDDGREVHRSTAKRFRQTGNTKTTPQLYRRAQVLDAVAAGTVVYLVEGEKDVHALESIGAVATTAPMGASNFTKVDVSPLEGARVVAVVDADASGERWALDVRKALTGHARVFRFVRAKTGKDAADHVAADGGLEDFVRYELPPPPEPDKTSPPHATLVKLSDVTRERVSWLWDGYLAAGKLHVLDGDPGLGKSTMLSDLAARITTGQAWPDGQEGTTPAGVVIMSAEDGLGDTIRPRLDAAGADVARVVALTGVTTWDAETHEPYERTPALPRDIDSLAIGIREVGAVLVIVDPFMAYLAGNVNSHRDQDIRRTLAPLAKMAEETGCAIVLVRHNTKGGGSNALYRGGGSIGIIGAARLSFTVGKDPEDDERRILAPTKANISALAPSLAYRLVDSPEHGCARVVWDDQPVTITADDLLVSSQESAEDREDRNDAATWLRSYLVENGGEAVAGDIFAAGTKVGFQRHTLQRARKRAGVDSRKSGLNSGWLWRLNVADSGEGDMKATKATVHGSLSPSSSSVSPSAKAARSGGGIERRCPECGEPVPAGIVRHPACFNTMQRLTAV